MTTPRNHNKLRMVHNKNNPELRIAYRRPDELTTAARNPRLHSPQQIRQIADSIRAYGFNIPIVVDGKGQIIAGHGRLAAARLLRLPRVPTIALDHLSEAQKRAFLLADNRLSELSSWDRGELAIELNAIAELDPQFDLTLTGFEGRDLDLALDVQPARSDPARNTAPEEVADVDRTAPAVTQPGDLWRLGPHRLLCGSALDRSDLQRLVGRRRAAMAFTDPPYNVRIDGHATGKGRVRHREFAMASGEMTEAEFQAFLNTAMRLVGQVLRDGALAYVTMDWRHFHALLSAGRAVFAELKSVCVWDKGAPGMGSLYRNQHELVAVFKNGTAHHINNIELGKHGRNRSTIWRYPGVVAQGAKGRDALAMHPTVKPVSMVADAIRDASRGDDLVIDVFAGSGTTLLAAQETGRVAAVLEIDPHYCDLIVRRWQESTGGDAKLESTGETYAARKRSHHLRTAEPTMQESSAAANCLTAGSRARRPA